MEITFTCPFNSTCEEIKDNAVHRCRLYVQIKGTDSQGNEHDNWNCSIAWLPILQIETSQTNRAIGSAVESARNVQDRNAQYANAMLGSYIKEIN